MANGWWNLDGAITSCVAAYQAIGAASLAASKVNLANPGTYDLSGSDDPVFDTSYGWRFVSVDGAVVGDALGTSTAIPVTGTWSIFVRFTEAADAGRGVCYLLSAHYGGQGYQLAAEHNTWNRNIRYGANNYSTSGRLLTDPHVWGFAGKQAYLDGTANGAEMAESTQIANRIMVIGATNYDGAIVFKSNVKIQAISIYNETLTVQNVADLTTAMNAL
jgi:hypothetical protein